MIVILRSSFLLAILLMGVAVFTVAFGNGAATPASTLFSTDSRERSWIRFRARGFSEPVCGTVNRLDDFVSNGLPLGGIDTGCLDLETTGLLGYCTIFNTHVPRRGPINLPILGLSVGGKTWVLCAKEPKDGHGAFQSGPAGKPMIPVSKDLRLDGVQTATEIHYWGHYPVADLEFEIDSPVSVGLRAWSPFLPGDVEGSMIPGAVLEVHLRNGTGILQKGTVAFSFPGPDPKETGSDRFDRVAVKGGFTGVEVKGKLASYAVGMIDEENVRVSGELGADGAAWAGIAGALPAVQSDQPGSSVALDFALDPGKEKAVRFVLTWYASTWRSGGYNWSESGNTFSHMYAKRTSSALAAAQVLARDHESLLRRILAWQQVIYTEGKLPVWLRETLVNILYLITEDGLWAQAAEPLPAWVRPEDGLFGLIESPRDCPQIECIPCSFYGNIPLVYFFPELALSTLRGYKGYQDRGGAPPWIFGGCTSGTPPIEFAKPTRGYQVTLNGPCYVDMLDRYLMCHGSKELLNEFYPSMKKATIFMVDLNRGPDGIISMPDRKVSVGPMEWETEWFEWLRWYGMSSHVGGIHLAHLRMAGRMAEQVGDQDFAEQCGRWIDLGQSSMESKMWNGSYYLNFWEEKTGKKSEHVFGYQLDGEWMAKFHGLPGVFRNDRVKTVLETIRRVNVPPTKYGAINLAHADGRVLKPGEFPMSGDYEPYHFFSSELLMLAGTYMYEGQIDYGLELARRSMNNIICEQGMAWDMAIIIAGDTGKRFQGNDYYQNMILWSLPAAIDGGDLTAPLKPGGLVHRVLKAARAK
ncbi:MAG: hypothetical protein HY717_24125 [Planctomycetes bacterium]|nr:hypothetical protein [Planctomycetota bacterium]